MFISLYYDDIRHGSLCEEKREEWKDKLPGRALNLDQ